jgi:hypothetical protein
LKKYGAVPNQTWGSFPQTDINLKVWQKYDCNPNYDASLSTDISKICTYAKNNPNDSVLTTLSTLLDCVNVKTFFDWQYWLWIIKPTNVIYPIQVVNLDKINKKFDLQTTPKSSAQFTLNCTYDDTGKITYNLPGSTVCTGGYLDPISKTYILNNCNGYTVVIAPTIAPVTTSEGYRKLDNNYW